MGQAPWWFTSTLPLAGVVLGVLLKWWVDESTEKRRRRRDDELRFIEERQQAYTKLYRAANQVSTILAFTHAIKTETDRVEAMHKQFSEQFPQEIAASDLLREALAMSEQSVASLRDAMTGLSESQQKAQGEMFEAYAAVALVAPPFVVDAAEACRRVSKQTGHEEHAHAVRAFLAAARRDLGR